MSLLGCTGGLTEMAGLSAPSTTRFPTESVVVAGPLAMPTADPPGLPGVVEALLRDGPASIERFATHPRLWSALEWAADRGFCRELATRPVPASDPTRAAHELAVATCRRDPAVDAGTLASLPTPQTGLARVQDAIARLHHGLPPDPAMLDPLYTIHTPAGRGGIGTTDDVHVRSLQLVEAVAWTDRSDQPELIEALLQATTPGTLDDAELAGALQRQTDPRLRMRYEARCPQCVAPSDPLADPDGAAMDPRVDRQVLLASFPRHRRVLLDALERQAARELPRRSPALNAIATVDWDRARAVAEEFPDSVHSRALLRFDDADAFRAHLDALGVRDPDPDSQLVLARQGPATAHAQLFDCGRVLPAQGEITLREAVVRAGLPLQVRLIESDSERWTVQLWSGTTRLQRIVEPWRLQDARSLAQLLNGTLDALESDIDVRFAVPKGTDDLVWGPRSGLEALDESGLLPLFEYDTAPDVVDEPPPPPPPPLFEDDGDGG